MVLLPEQVEQVGRIEAGVDRQLPRNAFERARIGRDDQLLLARNGARRQSQRRRQLAAPRLSDDRDRRAKPMRADSQLNRAAASDDAVRLRDEQTSLDERVANDKPAALRRTFNVRRAIIMASCNERSASSIKCSPPPRRTIVAVVVCSALAQSSASATRRVSTFGQPVKTL